MTTRVLVVDDHDQWRRHASLCVRRNLDCQLVGEVADGLEAVRQAERLEPDLILLDVGLPTLNGIEAARRILAVVPDSRILFLTEHHSVDILAAAMRTGAFGYVLKSDAGTELLPAIRAIIEGRVFISATLVGQACRTDGAGHVRQGTRRHEVELSTGETSLVDGFARFAEEALINGSAAIVVASSARRNLIYQRLKASGVGIDAAIEEGRYVPADIVDTLSTFMRNGWPDEALFWKAAAALVVGAAGASKGGHPRVAACGECAPVLWREGRAEAAIRLEQLWDNLARTYDVDILCGYSSDGRLHQEEGRIFQRICASHSAVHSR